MSEITKITEALRMNIMDLTENLSLEAGRVLDELYQKGHLTDQDVQLISSRQTDVDNVRRLLIKIKSSSAKTFTDFLDVLKSTEANFHLYEKLQKSLEDCQSLKLSAICVICLMTKYVSESYVADLLWHNGIIPNHLYDEIYFREQFGFFQRGSLWSEILKSLIKHDNVELSVRILKQALGEKFSHIGEMLERMPPQSPFECCCCKRRQKREKQSDEDTQSEISTTSSRETASE